MRNEENNNKNYSPFYNNQVNPFYPLDKWHLVFLYSNQWSIYLLLINVVDGILDQLHTKQLFVVPILAMLTVNVKKKNKTCKLLL